MKIKFKEYEFVDKCHPYNENGCRITPKIIDVYEMDLRLIPRKGEFVQRKFVIFEVTSVLYSMDTDEIVISVNPIKKPVKQPVTES